MAERALPAGERVRCAALARELGVQPAGTAHGAHGYVIVERPLPWPRDVNDAPESDGLAPALRAGGYRLQWVVPRGDLAPDELRVVCHVRPPGRPFAGFVRAEQVGSAADLLRVVADTLGRAERLAGAGVVDGDGGDGVVDVLLCAHGRRDVCCGSAGTALARDATARLDGQGVRVWRTSHLGGHRFAPTALVLPEGTMWGFADLALLHQVVGRTGHPRAVIDRYRGSPGLDSPEARALEGHALAEVGWPWLAWRRQAAHLAGGRVRLEGRSPAGDSRVWEASVTPGRRVPVPPCGVAPAPEHDEEPELRVADLHRGAERGRAGR